MNRNETNLLIVYIYTAFVLGIAVVAIFTLLLHESIEKAKDELKVHIEETINKQEYEYLIKQSKATQ